jgi:GMP reductase
MAAFDYEHINLIPRLCIVASRSECDTTVQLGLHKFNLPVVPANMECVIDERIAENLATHGYFYILHRFLVDDKVVAFCTRMKSLNLIISISVGVNEPSYDLLRKLLANDIVPDYITIDIAHGHALKMRDMIQFIRSLYANTNQPFIIAGNICTPEAVQDLETWGADATKVGIGGGSACSTFPNTGFGSRGIQASVIQACALVAKKPIIADGGIKEPSQIAKSIVLGATMCMVGGMLSSLKDSPGNIVRDSEGRLYKEFWGSASEHQSGKKGRIEGFKRLNLMRDKTILEELTFLTECLQSSVSYGGGKQLSDLQNVKFHVIS